MRTSASSVIRRMFYRAKRGGDTVIVYDRSASKFMKQFYDHTAATLSSIHRYVTLLLTPEDPVNGMSDPAEKGRRFKGAEHWMPIDPKAPQQRIGVLGPLNMRPIASVCTRRG
jgi:hypothetical protein